MRSVIQPFTTLYSRLSALFILEKNLLKATGDKISLREEYIKLNQEWYKYYKLNFINFDVRKYLLSIIFNKAGKNYLMCQSGNS
jgi:hypothetical protein